MGNIIVIGGGAAGMMAACAAGRGGHEVTLIEQNEKLGKKLFITGKGRCNLTNANNLEVLFSNVMSNPKFLYSAFYTFSNEMVMDFFREQGLALKTERGSRVFPVSDHSSDVIAVLKKALDAAGVRIRLNTRVTELLTEEQRPVEGEPKKPKLRISGVRCADRALYAADAVIVATGGLSYPSTGSTGDGYRFAAETGHRIVEPVPSLVPLVTEEQWVQKLQGLSLKNTAITICDGKKKLYEDFGEMLFTHFGVSGPMILSASAAIQPRYFERKLTLVIDLKPALDVQALDARILREFEVGRNKTFHNAVAPLFPAKLAPVMVELSGISPDKRVHEVTREERLSFGELIKHLVVTIVGKRDFDEAIITKGGVHVSDIDPSTMMSKRAEGLYFCGEVLDLDAATGGYNLQIAWSTGYLAGISVS